MEENKQIEITTFINPHMFWIVFEKNKEDRDKLEQILLEWNNSFKEAHITEGLAVVKDKQTWKRILIKSFNSNLNKYKGWLIDYGKNLTAETVYELPKEFTGQHAIAHSACLYNTIPLKSVLNVEQNKCIYEKQTRFNEGTIKIVKDYIQKANLITFYIENIYSNILCGSLHLVVNQNNINVIEMLIEKGHVAKDVELFLQAMKINMEKILQNNVYSRPLQKPENFFISESIGRGCLRNIQVSLFIITNFLLFIFSLKHAYIYMAICN
ncbi:hypothetical protein AMK59_2003 [Oryctes borbonicus]|uniref:Tudor domain-containing protein n=1 Tax=Oryctes borbonicus TaxID=1629725 RepID=A0A0T6BH45_9SCAR|nr:hypothetical protein AMK59_2003 [Oryctes borbonicus]